MTSDDAGSPTALREMTDGIAYFRRRRWPPDLHNAQYEMWAPENPNGDFSPEWWQQYQLPRLTRWIATRPVSHAVLTARFMDRIPVLAIAWRKACLPHSDYDIATVTWEQVKAFPNEVANIKPARRPLPPE